MVRKLGIATLALGLALGAFIIGGCATILSGPSSMVEIGSTPPGATVTINGSVRGKTPLVVDLPNRDYDVTIERKDHQPRHFRVEASFNWWTALSFAAFIVPGAIDMLSGAWLDIDRESYHFDLSPKGARPKRGAAAPALPEPPPEDASGGRKRSDSAPRERRERPAPPLETPGK